MNYKTIFIILILLTVISTLCICAKHPQMHKAVFVYNSDYKIVPTKEVITEQKEIPIMEKAITESNNKVETEIETLTNTQEIKIYEPQTVHENKKNYNKSITVKNTAPVKIQNTSAQTTSKINNKQDSLKNTAPQIDIQKIVNNNKEIQNNKTIEIPNNNTIATTKQTNQIKKITNAPAPNIIKTTPITIKAPEPKVLSAKEEEIAWNRWRSNLTNKIMQDTNFPAVPPGTMFHYTFNVDKYGKISNIQTWSDNSKYTPYAIQFMAPVIKNLQGRSILIFPQGTARTETKAWGQWKISNRTIYSTPNDYNDIEKITK